MTSHSEHDPAEHPGLDEPRPGHQLHDARERAGISRDSMAERLRISVEQLEALERDDYTELPAPAFVRGYFRAYARELGLDPDEYVAAYNRSGGAARDPEIRSGGVTDPASSGRGGMIGLLLITLVAAGGIAAWWYQQRMGNGGGDNGAADSVEQERSAADEPTDTDTPDTASDATGSNVADADMQGGNNGTASAEGATADDDAAATETVSVDVDAAEASVAASDDEDDADAAGEGAAEEAEQPAVATPNPESPESAADEGAGGETQVAAIGGSGNDTRTQDEAGDDASDPAASEDAVDDAGTESATASAEPGATSPAATDSPTRAATDAAGDGPDEITLEFSSRSWLEVYDDRDRELVYTLYFGSEPITLNGWAPFEVFLGNSPAVTVRYNGEAVDKSSFTRGNNTARFVVDASGVRAP